MVAPQSKCKKWFTTETFFQLTATVTGICPGAGFGVHGGVVARVCSSFTSSHPWRQRYWTLDVGFCWIRSAHAQPPVVREVQTGRVDQAPAVIRPLTPVLVTDPAGRGIRGGDDTITAVGELAAR